MVNIICENSPLKTKYQKPKQKELAGQYCKLYPFDLASHAKGLYKAFIADEHGDDWTYLPYGPFRSYDEFYHWLETTCLQDDPLFYTIKIKDESDPIGMLSFLNIAPAHGSIEIGHVHYSPKLQRTQAATEALFLMMCYVFDELGYRRLEWKCDNANQRSKRSAIRLGFTFEGLFRKHLIYKGRNRDTAWFSIVDEQ